MNFAKAHLSKYGWQEGKGLGKDETGITEAIKPKLKFDNTGIGYDGAENFTYFWWQHAFDSASKSIDVCGTKDISLKVSEEFDISTKRVSSKSRKSLIYNNFMKSATTLTNNGLVMTVAEDDDEETNELTEGDVVPKDVALTDEELFRACGGRTAHKGARHGLGLNGKLARIEEQERKLLLMMSSDSKVDGHKQEKKGKKKKRKSGADKILHDEVNDRETSKRSKKTKSTDDVEDFQDDPPTEKKKKRKKNKYTSDASLHPKILESVEVYESRNTIEQQNKKGVEIDDLQASNTPVENTTARQKNSKRKNIAAHSGLDVESRKPSIDENNPARRKKKKKVSDSDEEQTDCVITANSVEDGSSSLTDAVVIVKKAKKSKRK